ncbi:MAG: hypothetical protein JKY15_04135 [Deltaproteobacteria bacterium]|nr:hypothetical protein [Deltaproteobacteria bacterium]
MIASTLIELFSALLTLSHMHCYKAFGQKISSSLELPELPQADFDTPDIEINPANIAKPIFNIPQVGSFAVPNHQTVLFDSLSSTPEDHIRLFLLGSCMGVALQKKGYLLLHGNAIIKNNACEIFLGYPGAGKSTLAGRYIQQGYQILSDDVCAIKFAPEPIVMPGYPYIKLWEDSAKMLGHDIRQLKPIALREKKYHVPIHKSFCKEPMPLKKIHLLPKPSAVPSALNQAGNTYPRANARGFIHASASRIQKLQILLENTYRLSLIETPQERVRHLKQCQILQSSVPINLQLGNFRQ